MNLRSDGLASMASLFALCSSSFRLLPAVAASSTTAAGAAAAMVARPSLRPRPDHYVLLRLRVLDHPDPLGQVVLVVAYHVDEHPAVDVVLLELVALLEDTDAAVREALVVEHLAPAGRHGRLDLSSIGVNSSG